MLESKISTRLDRVFGIVQEDKHGFFLVQGSGYKTPFLVVVLASK